MSKKMSKVENTICYLVQPYDSKKEIIQVKKDNKKEKEKNKKHIMFTSSFALLGFMFLVFFLLAILVFFMVKIIRILFFFLVVLDESQSYFFGKSIYIIFTFRGQLQDSYLFCCHVRMSKAPHRGDDCRFITPLPIPLCVFQDTGTVSDNDCTSCVVSLQHQSLLCPGNDENALLNSAFYSKLVVNGASLNIFVIVHICIAILDVRMSLPCVRIWFLASNVLFSPSLQTTSDACHFLALFSSVFVCRSCVRCILTHRFHYFILFLNNSSIPDLFFKPQHKSKSSYHEIIEMFYVIEG